ncbi:MAG: YeeE/YedE thiosulfate transporter family protein [Planctomycetaceae bacterium]
MFDSPSKLALGLATGIIFGFLLQKGRVAKFEVIVGQFLFKDWTVVKMMGTAVVVGAIGVYGLVAADMASLHIRPAILGGLLLGALCFGVGMAILGYCPGTSVAGCGEGRLDAMVGVLGMFAGAAVYVAFFEQLTPITQSLGDWGKITLPEVTHTSPWLWVAILAAFGIAALFYDRSRRGPRTELAASLPQRASAEN